MSTCCTSTSTILGPRGRAGIAGRDGVDGINAFTFTTAGFTMPASGNTVTVSVEENRWIVENGTPASGQALHVQNAGVLIATQLMGTDQVVLLNDGAYVDNAPGGTFIPSGSKVSPSGLVVTVAVGTGAVFSGIGNPNGVLMVSGSAIYYDTTGTGSLWYHDTSTLSNSVWHLKVE